MGWKQTQQILTLGLSISIIMFKISMPLKSTNLSDEHRSDEDLAAWIAQGNIAALENLYDRYAPMVFGIALKILGDRAAAEEVLQETFWRLWTNKEDDKPDRKPFTGWLFRLARALAMERKSRQPWHFQPILQPAEKH